MVAIRWVDVDGAHDWQIPPTGMPVTLTGTRFCALGYTTGYGTPCCARHGCYGCGSGYIIRRAVNEPELILIPDVPARILGLGPAPQPVQLALLAALPQYEARLVQVTGQVVSSASGTWLMAADRAQVAVRTSPVIMATLSGLSRSPVTLVGVVVSAPTGLVLLPRDPHDILAPVSSPQATAGAVAQVWPVVHVLASSDVW